MAQGSAICADESNAYDTRRVNHSVEYRADDGTANNLAESYFPRFRSIQYGQTHRDWCEYWQGNKRGEERLAA